MIEELDAEWNADTLARARVIVDRALNRPDADEATMLLALVNLAEVLGVVQL